MEDKNDFLERILGFSTPWIIEKTVDTNEQVDIYLSFQKGTKFKCEHCGLEHSAFDVSWKTYRHLDLWQYKTFIHVKVPRIKCNGKVTTIRVDWLREGSHFTLLMEQYILDLVKETTVSGAAKLLREHDTKLWRVILYYVEKCRQEADFSTVKNIGIDETSKKGRHFLTNFVNLDTRRILFIADGKDASTVDAFKQDFEGHKGKADNIKNVTSDMTLAYESKIKEHFEKAVITIDKFHVMKHMNEAVNKVRIEETVGNPLLKKQDLYG